MSTLRVCENANKPVTNCHGLKMKAAYGQLPQDPATLLRNTGHLLIPLGLFPANGAVQ